jgi:histidinol-phosphatase
MGKNDLTGRLKETLEWAAELARKAGRITLQYYRRELTVELKSDASPVTIADRETEKFIRSKIRERWPDHGILGEELGEENPGAPWRWIIDPIDGTRAFIHGVPLYCVMLALELEREVVVGVVHNPPQDETVAAAMGLGCTFNGQLCRVSRTGELKGAWVHTTDYAELARRRPKFCADLTQQAGFCRTWGDAYGYLLVATGRADAMIDPIMNPWDIAALKPIILEAGGRLTDLNGEAAVKADNVLATNGALHEELLKLVRLDDE